MKLPLAWLRDYLDMTLSSDEIVARLAMLGFPVDEHVRRPQMRGVVIGKLVKVAKHPNADALQLCTVDVGKPELLTIATAATNVAEGDVVPVAVVGAELAGGLSIGLRKMRGIDSQGMLCSAGELALEPEWFEDGILQLERDLPLGDDVIARYRLCDDVLDVDVTPNRVDCLSVVGLARELAASLARSGRATALREPELLHVAGEPAFRDVVLESPDCRRFVAQRFSNVHAAVAPFWMRVRLALAGQRPIDSLVDISNFVMLEVGQPLHFYDFERMAGPQVVVRDARAGEVMRTLDDEERTLDPRFLVIADARDAQCIAGLKGAAASEVRTETREVLLEAAAFSGPRVRRMSVALGLRTEASNRHEKGLPLGLSTWGAARAAYLLAQCGATAHAPFAAGTAGDAQPAVTVTVSHAAALLGMPVDAAEARAALDALGFAVEDAGEGALRVTPPAWRGDVTIPEDVVEEIGRIAGYDRIAAVMPPVLGHAVQSTDYRNERRTAAALAAHGYREVVTLALQPANVGATYERAGLALPGSIVEILNPVNEDQRYLRFSLLPGLLALAAQHARDAAYRIFEIGHVFAGDDAPQETAGVAWLLALPHDAENEPAWRDAGFLQFKGESEALLRALGGRFAGAARAALDGWHPGKTASLQLDGKNVATIGALDPRLLAAFDVRARAYAGWMRMDDLPVWEVPRYAAPSRFPSMERDLALVVAPDVTAHQVEDAVRGALDGLVHDVHVFDEYRGPQVGENKKSLAVRFTLQRSDATLTDVEAESLVATIVAALRERCDAVVRSA